MARRFFYVCAGMLMLVLTYHIGATAAGADSAAMVTPHEVAVLQGALDPGDFVPLPGPGTRIRLSVRTPERERWIGPFISLVNDSVTMRDGDTNGAILTVPMLSVTKLEISRGEQTNGLRGAGVGFVAGALLGVGVALATYSYNEAYSAEGGAVMAGVSLGVVGAAIGGLIGVFSPSERWREHPLKDLHATPGTTVTPGSSDR